MQKRILILFFTSFFSLNLSAQDKYRAVHWGLDEGLSQGETYHMIKDVNGFLWIGTRYGLNRFDGNTFKVYLPQRNNNKSIISDHVIAGLIEDSLHNIWIGSEDKGVSRYNIKTDDFTNFFPGTKEKNEAGTIFPFWATKDEVLCLENDSKLIAYNIYTSEKKILAKPIDPKDRLGNTNEPYTIFDSKNNTVWFLVGNPERKAFLMSFNLSTNEKLIFEFPDYRPDYFEAEAMCFDTKRNCIWINANKGLLQFTFNDKKFHYINALSKYERVKDYGRFVGITLDKQGRVWFATHPLGIIIYDPDNDSVSFPFSDYEKQKQIGEFNACLYGDRDGIVWSGFWLRKGLDGIFPFNRIVKHYPSSEKKDSLNGNIVIGAKDAGVGKIWVGSQNGIFILDKEAARFKALPAEDLPGIKSGFASAIAIDTVSQKVWLTANGIFRIDMAAKKTTPIIFKNFNNSTINTNHGIPKLDGQQIFFSSFDDSSSHVYLLNLMSDTAREIFSFPPNLFNMFFTTPVENRFLFLQGLKDEKNNRTYENKNGKWILAHTPVDSIRWTSIFYERKNSSYWVAGEMKIFHFDAEFKPLKIYSKEDGLAELLLYGLISDNNGNIWFHTDRSIQELNVETGQIKTMGEADGFEKELFEGLAFVDKDAAGDIYYGGGVYGSGLDRISPKNKVSTISNIYLKSLSINQKLFPLKTSINYTDTLSLKYNQTKIAIEAGIIDFYSRGQSRIRYKLEKSGAHEQWQYAPYYYTIRYEGLQPGDYQLTIQASNASNEFDGPQRILAILISPPFWQTWWFRVLAAIVILVTIYGFIQYRSRNLRKRNVILEEKVLHRTKELKHSLEELRETQTQLIQREKMASLGELTAGIAHEIQNPLNFVNNFSEVSNDLLDEMNEEIDKGNIGEVKAISGDVKQNLEKILHHGKRADSIVKGMLQHSRSSTGVKEPTDINALADEYLRLAFHGLRAKDKSFNATMKTDFDETIGKMNIIPQDVGRVILNLITNAFYAVTEKAKQVGNDYKPTVTVSTKKINNKVEIKVRDNGNGIPQKILEKIFQPFFTTKPTGEGTGLGLSLSYDIITKAHNGELKVDSRDGEYAEFTISLPV